MKSLSPIRTGSASTPSSNEGMFCVALIPFLIRTGPHHVLGILFPYRSRPIAILMRSLLPIRTRSESASVLMRMRCLDLILFVIRTPDFRLAVSHHILGRRYHPYFHTSTFSETRRTCIYRIAGLLSTSGWRFCLYHRFEHFTSCILTQGSGGSSIRAW